VNSTLLTASDITVSNAPNGIATDIGILIQDGTLPLKNLILQDFAPTYVIEDDCNHIQFHYSRLPQRTHGF
jgi:hypothetical protein